MDSKCENYRIASTNAFIEEINWNCHLGLPAIICPTPSFDCYNYASTLNTLFHDLYRLNVWIRIPLMDPRVLNENDEYNIKYDTWENWNKFRLMCNNNKNISVALELTDDLPDSKYLKRWDSEPVDCVIIPTSVFITNNHGYPVLPESHKRFLLKMLDRNVQMMIKGRPRHPDGFEAYLKVFFNYIRILIILLKIFHHYLYQNHY